MPDEREMLGPVHNPTREKKSNNKFREKIGATKGENTTSTAGSGLGSTSLQVGFKLYSLNALVEQVFVHIKDGPSIKWPERIHAPPKKRSRDKYYRFHRDHGHDTNDYFDLNEQIVALIQRGRLQRFVIERLQVRLENTYREPPARHKRRLEGPIEKIRVISGGFAGGGESNSVRNCM